MFRVGSALSLFIHSFVNIMLMHVAEFGSENTQVHLGPFSLILILLDFLGASLQNHQDKVCIKTKYVEGKAESCYF